jgi:hypothetical protein
MGPGLRHSRVPSRVFGGVQNLDSCARVVPTGNLGECARLGDDAERGSLGNTARMLVVTTQCSACVKLAGFKGPCHRQVPLRPCAWVALL